MARAPYPVNSESNSLATDTLLAMLHGGKCLGYADMNFDDAPAVGFADLVGGIPSGARSAIVFIEADATEADLPRVAMFREDGVDPTAAAGMPVGDNGTFEIRGEGNMEAFKIIGITAAKVHTMRVQFYGEG